MTSVEKFALARGMHEAAMDGKPPQAQAWIRQQFDCCMRAILEVLRTEADRGQFRALVARDNWLERDNPFKDDEGE